MKIETTLEEVLKSYDWESAFKYASEPVAAKPGDPISCAAFSRECIKKVIGTVEGQNDGNTWVGVFKLHDKRHAVLRAGCDYTGWG